MEKTKELYIYIYIYILLRKAQGKTPLNKKGNKRLNKNNDQWCPISKK
jgi:hypothetical protein